MANLSHKKITMQFPGLQSNILEIECTTSKLLKRSNGMKQSREKSHPKKYRQNKTNRKHKISSRIESKYMNNKNNYAKFLSF